MSEILQQFDQIQEFLKIDPKASELKRLITEADTRLKVLYPYASDKDYTSCGQLHDEMNQLTTQYVRSKESLQQYLTESFADFASNLRYKTIFSRILDDSISRETLCDVLRKFESFQNGKLNYAQGFNQGLNYITKKAALPKDFFNRMPE